MADEQERLEAELRELGTLLDLPPTPDVTAAVRARLHHRPAVSWRPWLFRAAAALVALVVLTAASAAVSPRVRAALSDVIGLFGVELHRGAGPQPQGTGTLPGSGR